MSLRDLLRVETAEVRKAGRRAGTLVRVDGGCRFAYDGSYDGPAVAWTLPLGAEPVWKPAGAVPPFFAGLLPEGRRLVALQRALKTSADDELSLLLAVGQDTIGDVQVVPEGGAVHPRPSSVEPADLAHTTFQEVFDRVVGPDPEDRIGIAGVQPKVSAGMVSVPISWGDRPSILKLDPPEYPGVVDNEARMLSLAAAIGLPVPEHEVISDAAGEKGLLLARFDRTAGGDGSWRALAQEDATQVLGLYPADKYRPSTEEVLSGLRAVCGAPVVAARDLYRQVVFAFLTCNGDAHAKNFSVLQGPDGEWRVAPAYDLPSTHPYGDTTLALSIGGRDREDVGERRLLQLAEAIALPERAARRILERLADAVEQRMAWFDDMPYDRRRVHKLKRAIAWRIGRVRGR